MDGLLATLTFHQPLLPERLDGCVVPWEAVTAMTSTLLATRTQLQGPPFGPGKLQDTWRRAGHDPCWWDDHSFT